MPLSAALSLDVRVCCLWVAEDGAQNPKPFSPSLQLSPREDTHCELICVKEITGFYDFFVPSSEIKR